MTSLSLLWKTNYGKIHDFIKNAKTNITNLSSIEQLIVNDEFFEEFFIESDITEITDKIKITIEKYDNCKLNNKFKYNILDDNGNIINEYDILDNGKCVAKTIVDAIVDELNKYSSINNDINLNITAEILETLPKDNNPKIIKYSISKILKKYFGNNINLLIYSIVLILILNNNVVLGNSEINTQLSSIYESKVAETLLLTKEKNQKMHFDKDILSDFKKIEKIEQKSTNIINNLKLEKTNILDSIITLFPNFNTDLEFNEFKKELFLNNVEIFKNKYDINLISEIFDIKTFKYDKYLKTINNLLKFINDKYNNTIAQKYNTYNSYIENMEDKAFSLIELIGIDYDTRIETMNNRNNKLIFELLQLTNMENADKYLTKIISSYYEIEYLGGGISGKVYKALDLNTNEIVIVKKLKNNELVDDEINNLEYIKSFCEDYFICLLDMKKTEKYTYIITKYDKNFISLDKVINNIKNNNKMFYHIVTDIINSIRTLHYTGMVHHDIKPENIIVDLETSKIKLIDFTSSCTDYETCMKSIVGDFNYIYPELAKSIISKEEGLNFEYSEKADLFSIGCIIYKIITGTTPNKANSLLYNSYDDFYDNYKFTKEGDINYDLINMFLNNISITTETELIDISYYLNI